MCSRRRRRRSRCEVYSNVNGATQVYAQTAWFTFPFQVCKSRNIPDLTEHTRLLRCVLARVVLILYSNEGTGFESRCRFRVLFHFSLSKAFITSSATPDVSCACKKCHLHKKEGVQTYNSTFSKEYAYDVVHNFKKIIVVTKLNLLRYGIDLRWNYHSTYSFHLCISRQGVYNLNILIYGLESFKVVEIAFEIFNLD